MDSEVWISLSTLQLSNVQWNEISASVGSELGDTLTGLTIYYGTVVPINKDMFEMMPYLTRLFMDSCNIGIIYPETFNGLNYLRDLSLQGNRISEEQIKILKSLQGTLTYLRLSNNRIASIPDGTFEGFTVLESLLLASNQISELISGRFHGLQSLTYLDLGENMISAVEPGSFEGLSSLQSLYLNSNNIATIQPETFGFSGLSSLTSISLQQNSFTTFEWTAFNLSCTETPGKYF